MYALEGLGDLGAKQTPLEKLQKSLAILQKRLASEQAQLAKVTNPKKQGHIQASITETLKKISDQQLQIAALQAGVPPIVPPSTTVTGTTPATPTSPSADITQLIPVSGSIDYTQPVATSGAVPTPGTPAAPLVAIGGIDLSTLFSNPWILGGGALLLFMMIGKRRSA